MRKFFLILLVFCGFMANATEIRKLDVWKSGDVFYVDLVGYVDAPISQVYDVLVDYDQLDRLSSYIVDSRILEPAEDGTPLVYTLTRKCVFLFCGKIEKVERLELEPLHHITATAIPERSNVVHGLSEWRLSEEDNGTLIEFRQELDPDFWVPPVFGPMMIKKVMRQGGRRAILRVEYYARIAAGLSAEEPPPLKRKRKRRSDRGQ
ncbi:MAG: SRPBCC family protein [Gammaproteobacteria bacterium]|nr:SRPBCC family protein [Gammaproteobacteria bacterium]